MMAPGLRVQAIDLLVLRANGCRHPSGQSHSNLNRTQPMACRIYAVGRGTDDTQLYKLGRAC